MKKIIVIGSVVAVLVIAIFGFLLFGPKADDSVVILASDNGGSCFVTEFPKNSDIEIELNIDNVEMSEDGDSAGNYGIDTWVSEDPSEWKVRDLTGNYIDAEVVVNNDKVTIKAPKGGYESGGIYFLDIGPNAKFANDEYGMSRHLVFGVDRGQSEIAVFQENVHQLDDANCSVEGNKITLDGDFVENDIVITDIDNDRYEEAIKLTNVSVNGEKTEATIEEPTVEEVYKELDIFTVKIVDFSQGQLAEGVNDSTQELGFLNHFGTPVYADEEEKDGWSIEKGEFIASTEKDGDKRIGEAGFSFGMKYQKDDVTLDLNFDTAAVVVVVAQKSDLSAYGSVSFENKNNIHFNVGKTLEVDEKLEISELINQYRVNKNQKNADISDNYDIISADIPIIGPIGVGVDIFAHLAIELSAQFDSSLNTNAGLFAEASYSLLTGEYSAKHEVWAGGDYAAKIMGHAEAFAGLGAKVYIGIPVICELGIRGIVGPYAELNGAISCDGTFGLNRGMTFNLRRGMVRLSGGVKAEASVDLDSGVLSEPFVIYEVPEYKNELFSKDTGKALSGVNIPERFIVNDGGINIKALTATYYDTINDTEVTDDIKGYTLYIDGAKVDNPEKLDSKTAAIGKHEISIEWKYEGHDYEFKKSVEFVDAIPGELTPEAASAYLEWLDNREGSIKEQSGWFYDDHMHETVAFADVSGDELPEMIYLERSKLSVYPTDSPEYFSLDIHVVTYDGSVKELTSQEEWMGQSPNSFKTVMQTYAGGVGGFALYKRSGEQGKGVRLIRQGGGEADSRSYFGFEEDMQTHASSSHLFYSNSYSDGESFIYGASGVAEATKSEWEQYFAEYKRDIDYEGSLIFYSNERILINNSRNACGMSYDEAIRYLEGLGGDISTHSNDNNGNSKPQSGTGVDNILAGYKEVLNSLVAGDGRYTLTFDNVSPVDYALEDISYDGVPELLVGASDDWNPGVRYVAVFYYDPSDGAIKMADGSLVYGVAGAGGFRGSVGIGDGEDGYNDLYESSWASASGQGSTYKVWLEGGTLNRELHSEFQIGDESSEYPDTREITWTEVDNLEFA